MSAYITVVTGASGYIGTELTKQLLEKGYTVRATVRDKDAKKKVAHLTALGAALPGKLELVNADLLKEGDFDEICSGAHFVFHTASPYFLDPTDPQKQLLDPALKGTANVMGAVVKNKDTVKRVVLTSSVAAIRSHRSTKGPINPPLYSDKDWNEMATLETEPYPYSKVMAEKEAWRIAEQHGLDLVTIHPVFVVGPVLSDRDDAASVQMIVNVLEGTKAIPIASRYCDVRDTARAHILAAEVPGAHGRYLVSHVETVPSKFISDALQERFPEFDIAMGPDDKPVPMIDMAKTESELGLRLTPLKETLQDMAVTLVNLGVAKPKRKAAAANGTA